MRVSPHIAALLPLFLICLGATPADVRILLGKNVTTVEGSTWPVDDDGNYFHDAHIPGPTHVRLILPDATTLDADVTAISLAQCDDKISAAVLVLSKAEPPSVLHTWPVHFGHGKAANESAMIGGARIFLDPAPAGARITIRSSR